MEGPCQEVQNQDLKAHLPQHNSHISEVPITLKEAHQQLFINQALLLCGRLWPRFRVTCIGYGGVTAFPVIIGSFFNYLNILISRMRTRRLSEAGSHSRNAAELGLWPRLCLQSTHTTHCARSGVRWEAQQGMQQNTVLVSQDPVCKLNCLGITNT